MAVPLLHHLQLHLCLHLLYLLLLPPQGLCLHLLYLLLHLSSCWWSSTSSSTGGTYGRFKPAWGRWKKIPKTYNPQNNGASREHHNPPRAEPRTHNPSCHSGDVKPQAAVWGGGKGLVMHPNDPKHFSEKKPTHKGHLLRDRKAWKAPKISCWKQLGKMNNWVWATEGVSHPHSRPPCQGQKSTFFLMCSFSYPTSLLEPCILQEVDCSSQGPLLSCWFSPPFHQANWRCVCVKARKESATKGCRKLEVGKLWGCMGVWVPGWQSPLKPHCHPWLQCVVWQQVLATKQWGAGIHGCKVLQGTKMSSGTSPPPKNLQNHQNQKILAEKEAEFRTMSWKSGHYRGPIFAWGAPSQRTTASTRAGFSSTGHPHYTWGPDALTVARTLDPTNVWFGAGKENLGRDRHKPLAPPLCSPNVPIGCQHVIPSNCQSIWPKQFIPRGNADNGETTVTSKERTFSCNF